MKTGVFFIGLFCLLLLGCTPREEEALAAKPVLYLYPETETAVRVTLDYAGTLTSTWPSYEDGWEVIAQPDGSLFDAQGNCYSYLFWEGVDDTAYDFSQGFCVAGADTGAFLRKTLSEIGLTPREYNEMIVYWLPQMEGNAYNLISFQGDAYTDRAKLDITPAPESLLRVFMAWKPAEQATELAPQSFDGFQRQGFTAVEWGGAKIS